MTDVRYSYVYASLCRKRVWSHRSAVNGPIIVGKLITMLGHASLPPAVYGSALLVLVWWSPL